MSAPHPYDPLSDTTSHPLRILLLEPSRDLRSPLRGRLVEADLDAQPKPTYHALSYVWESASSSRTDSIELKTLSSGYATLSITGNCGEALRHLRLHEKDRALWVDAICINQDDVQEKSRQVQMMSLVYYRATKVIMWLDLSIRDAKECRRIFKFVNSTASLFKRGLLRSGRTGDRGPLMHLAEKRCKARFSDVEYNLIMWILRDSYFSRAWTVQEMGLASVHDIDMVTCSGTLSWYNMVVVLHLPWILDLKGFNNFLVNELRCIIPIMISRGIYINSENSMTSISNGDTRLGLASFMSTHLSFEGILSFEASNPKDKAYAFLWGLSDFDAERAGANPGQALEIFDVDYTKSLERIFTEFTIAIMYKHPSFCPLYMACQGGRRSTHPSWVPDWASSAEFEYRHKNIQWRRAVSRDGYKAGGPTGTSDAVVHTFSTGVMLIRGHPVTTLARCCPMPYIFAYSNVMSEAITLELQHWLVAFDALVTKLKEQQGHGDWMEQLAHLAWDNYDGEPWSLVDLTLLEKDLQKRKGLDIKALRLRLLVDLTSSFLRFVQFSVEDNRWYFRDETWPDNVQDILKSYIPRERLDIIVGDLKNQLLIGYFHPFRLDPFRTLAGLCCDYIRYWESFRPFTEFGDFGGKPIFVTESGKVGAALGVQPGDEVVLWEGVKCPMIIRKAAESQGHTGYHCTIVSTSYIRGMMAGEEYREQDLMDYVIH